MEFSTISADSQNTLDTWIKQNHQQHWFLLQPDFQFTSALDITTFGTVASLLNCLYYGDEVEDDRRLQDDMNHWKEFKYDHATQEKEHKKQKRELNKKLEQIKYVLSHRAEQTH